MLRLFGASGLLILISAILAWGTGALFFRLLTALLAAALVLFYCLMRRTLPPRRGSLRLSGLREQVEVYWDDRGVPHVYARNLHDLYMAQGYVTAQDRLWSMDLGRRSASGRLAELFGEKWLPVDKHFRILGFRRAAEQSLAAYSTEVQGYLQAYAVGVNARISEGKLPPEFALLRYHPEPWTPVDTLALGKQMAYDLSGNWAGEAFRARLIQVVGAEKAAELFWLEPDSEQLQALEDLTLPDLDTLLEMAAATLQAAPGSNNLAASGEKSRTGAPLLATDPHLGVRVPSFWYQTHLIGPDGMDVTGVTLPGVPGIILGHNREIAWGLSNLNTDAQDLFIEQRNPAAPDEFRYRGAWEKAAVLQEEIQVRGCARPVSHEVLVTRHGPVLTADRESALSLSWPVVEPTTEVAAFLAVNRARSWPEFREALRLYNGAAVNFLYAGRDNTIALRAGGRIPIRAGGDGQAPVPGWSGEHEWQGCIPFEELPERVNPPEGFLTTANHEVAPPDYPYALGSCWYAPYRFWRTSERLHRAADLTAEKMQRLQLDCVNLQARSLLELLLNAVQEGLRQGVHQESLSPLEKKAMLMISGWDCNEMPDAAAPALWHQWYLFLVEGIFRPQMGLVLFDHFLSCGMPAPLTDRLVQRVAAGGESQWLTREGEGSFGRIALRAFRRAVALLAAKQGQEPERWRWGLEHKLTFVHPLTEARPALKPLLNLGPFPVGGSSTTVNHLGYSQVHPFRATTAAVWRQVVNLAAPDETQEISVPGQSGHPFSTHYADQVTPWLKGEYQPQLYRHSQIRSLPCLVLHPGAQPVPAAHHADAAD